MSNTLILLFHPNSEQSKTNIELCKFVSKINGVEIIDIQKLYPDDDINIDTEINRLITADRLVLQFPFHWYSTPPILQKWFDTVLTRMFYINYLAEGKRIKNLPLMISLTTGNTSDSYTEWGSNMFTIEELLAPLQATAHRCGMIWTPPFITYNAKNISSDELESSKNEYKKRLLKWTTS